MVGFRSGCDNKTSSTSSLYVESKSDSRDGASEKSENCRHKRIIMFLTLRQDKWTTFLHLDNLA